MDAISPLTTNSVYQYLVMQIEQRITSPMRNKFVVIDAGVQRTGTDLPPNYIFYDVNEGAPSKHTLAPLVYSRPIDILIEINSSAENFNDARAVRDALENLFLQGFAQYSIIIGEMVGKRNTTLDGYQLVLAIPLTYIYTNRG